MRNDKGKLRRLCSIKQAIEPVCVLVPSRAPCNATLCKRHAMPSSHPKRPSQCAHPQRYVCMPETCLVRPLLKTPSLCKTQESSHSIIPKRPSFILILCAHPYPIFILLLILNLSFSFSPSLHQSVSGVAVVGTPRPCHQAGRQHCREELQQGVQQVRLSRPDR